MSGFEEEKPSEKEDLNFLVQACKNYKTSGVKARKALGLSNKRIKDFFLGPVERLEILFSRHDKREKQDCFKWAEACSSLWTESFWIKDKIFWRYIFDYLRSRPDILNLCIEDLRYAVSYLDLLALASPMTRNLLAELKKHKWLGCTEFNVFTIEREILLKSPLRTIEALEGQISSLVFLLSIGEGLDKKTLFYPLIQAYLATDPVLYEAVKLAVELPEDFEKSRSPASRISVLFRSVSFSDVSLSDVSSESAETETSSEPEYFA